MKRKLLLATTVVAALVITGCDKKLDNDQKKASYAIGQQIGTNLKGQNIDFDPAVVAMSLKDVSTIFFRAVTILKLLETVSSFALAANVEHLRRMGI